MRFLDHEIGTCNNSTPSFNRFICFCGTKKYFCDTRDKGVCLPIMVGRGDSANVGLTYQNKLCNLELECALFGGI